MKVINGTEIIDIYESWGVQGADGHVVEFEDKEHSDPNCRFANTAENQARAYAQTFGGTVKQQRVFYGAWVDAD